MLRVLPRTMNESTPLNNKIRICRINIYLLTNRPELFSGWMV